MIIANKAVYVNKLKCGRKTDFVCSYNGFVINGKS